MGLLGPFFSQRCQGLQPAWDYCVNDNFDIKWRPKQVADKSLDSKKPISSRIHGTGIFTGINGNKNMVNVGKYTIHGSYGIGCCFLLIA